MDISLHLRFSWKNKIDISSRTRKIRMQFQYNADIAQYLLPKICEEDKDYSGEDILFRFWYPQRNIKECLKWIKLDTMLKAKSGLLNSASALEAERNKILSPPRFNFANSQRVQNTTRMNHWAAHSTVSRSRQLMKFFSTTCITY